MIMKLKKNCRRKKEEAIVDEKLNWGLPHHQDAAGMFTDLLCIGEAYRKVRLQPVIRNQVHGVLLCLFHSSYPTVEEESIVGEKSKWGLPQYEGSYRECM
jgi:hypothetical protein